MGLAIVELILATEEASGIRIPDEAIADIATFDELVTVILELHPEMSDDAVGKLGRVEARLKLREVFAAHLDLPLDQIRHDSRFDELIPGDYA